MIIPQQVIGAEDKDISGRGQDSLKFCHQILRIEGQLVPLGHVVVDLSPPVKFHVAGAVAGEIVGRIRQNQVDGVVRDLLEGFKAVCLKHPKVFDFIYIDHEQVSLK